MAVPLRSGFARAALFPARATVHAWRGGLAAVADDVVAGPAAVRIVDRALAGPLPEELARSLMRHHVLERVVRELAASGDLERLIRQAMTSDEFDRMLSGLVSSPTVRGAIARESVGLTEQVAADLRSAARRFDDRAERYLRRERQVPTNYAGLGTRAAALAIDALLSHGLFAVLAAVFALIASLVGGLRPHWLAGTLLGAGWLLIVGGYFVLFWSTSEQTPGMRLLRLRLRVENGTHVSVRRSCVRALGLALAIIPCFAGFVTVLFDDRRRALPDFLSGTAVVYEPEDPAGAVDA